VNEIALLNSEIGVENDTRNEEVLGSYVTAGINITITAF
jgi:hypothetical protein